MTFMDTVMMNATRVYVRTVRMARGLSQDAVAKHAGLSIRAYTDWELGRTEEIKTAPLMRVLDFLQASADHVKQLVVDNAGDADAQRLADEVISKIQRLPPEEREARRQHAIAIVDDLLAEPRKLDRWVGYGERLKEEP